MDGEIRMARLVAAFGKVRRGGRSRVAAAAALGLSERHFRRLYGAYEEDGAEAIVDRRRRRAASNRAPPDVVDWVETQYRTRYFDFSARHFHEALSKAHGEFRYGYTWTKSVLYLRGCLTPSARRGPHRTRRERSAMAGQLVFQDGSTHDWFCGRRPPCDLIVTLDDATGAMLSAFFVAQEGTESSFRGLRETIEGHGLFASFYTDRGSHYFFTPKAGNRVDKAHLTQVGRALLQLGIAHIPSYAPQGRGRMERVFGTLQGRLPQELRLAGIDDIESANAWLAGHYIAAFNKRFAIPASADDDVFIAFAGDLANILCVQEDRVVGGDNCVRYEGRVLQIPEQSHRRHFVRANVRVHEYGDGGLAIFSGPREIARFGAPEQEEVAPRPAARSKAPCSRPSRPSPAGGADAPALTAAARDAPNKLQAGTKKRRSQPNQETCPPPA
jgi:Winged helix-turn helix